MTQTSFAEGQLKSIVERIERLEQEKRELASDIKDIYTEAKFNGYDTKALRKVVALRRKDAAERAEEEAMIALYMNALGMLADTPLGQAAVERSELNDAIKRMGKPVPVTDEERAKGVLAAFDKDGMRMSIGTGTAA